MKRSFLGEVSNFVDRAGYGDNDSPRIALSIPRNPRSAHKSNETAGNLRVPQYKRKTSLRVERNQPRETLPSISALILSLDRHHEETPRLIQGLSETLSRWIYFNELLPSNSSLLARTIHNFNEYLYPIGDGKHTFEVPSPADIRAFLAPIVHHKSIPVECIVSAAVYLSLFQAKYHSIFSSNWRNLLLVALLVALKFNEDETDVHNGKWIGALFAEMSVKHLNALERKFLRAIDFSLWVSQEYYREIYKALMDPAVSVPV
eukprot:TRINITY_DN15697_c0_g1_i1.p1 TRINITY_DN15697_c0_g1~~TRINITY_DN15697_c0_g1_i1.p1  ORF type:complete len:261 (+),score=41.44 TRINITY_DN15697_c0_g1_i1:64-846(+)